MNSDQYLIQKKIIFFKMHGLGNDFVIINHRDIQNTAISEQFVQKISARYFGLGCDQLIIYKKLSGPASYEMLIYNANGSAASACGNAARCITCLIDREENHKNITLKTVNRELKCELVDKMRARVNMGMVEFEKSWMPSDQELFKIANLYNIDRHEIVCTDIGNKHIVIFGNYDDVNKTIIGKQIHKEISDKINIDFAKITSKGIELSVFESGAGLTLACGSGACASFAAAKKLGFVEDKGKIIFANGSLDMEYTQGEIIMEGPASFVASGQYYLT